MISLNIFDSNAENELYIRHGKIKGFTVNDDTIEVVIDEKYEVPTKLKRFVNYPSISTGVDVSPMTLTWIGLGLAGAAGLIVAVGTKKKPVSRHARKRK